MNLFICGTLALGKPNEHLLQDIKGTWMKGSIKGELVQSGWGANLGFPGIVLDSNGDQVHGLIFCSEELELHRWKLDEFEGKEYQRILTPALLENAKSVDTYLYAISKFASKWSNYSLIVQLTGFIYE